jgi:hypothetical protein
MLCGPSQLHYAPVLVQLNQDSTNFDPDACRLGSCTQQVTRIQMVSTG